LALEGHPGRRSFRLPRSALRIGHGHPRPSGRLRLVVRLVQLVFVKPARRGTASSCRRGHLGHLAALLDLWYQSDTMRHMPNVHIRDVPPETLELLKEAARRRGRSLNAEIVDALVTQAERERRSADLLERLAEGRRRWKKWFPEGFPPGLEPETIIRQDRDSR